MNDLKIFSNEKFGTVRTVIKDNEPWFVAADVCKALEIDRTQSRRLDDDEKGVYSIQTPGGEQEVSVVNEPGLYTLVLGSRKPEAKEFKRWITHEVIPSIRKHGMYAKEELIDKMIGDPDYAISLITALKEEREAKKALEAQNAIMAPKAEYFDDLIDRSVNLNFRTVAKEFGVKEKWFIGKLKAHGFIYKDSRGQNVPYAEKNNGLFVVKECKGYYSDWAGVQTFITPKGRETFRRFVKKWKDE